MRLISKGSFVKRCIVFYKKSKVSTEDSVGAAGRQKSSLSFPTPSLPPNAKQHNCIHVHHLVFVLILLFITFRSCEPTEVCAVHWRQRPGPSTEVWLCYSTRLNLK